MSSPSFLLIINEEISMPFNSHGFNSVIDTNVKNVESCMNLADVFDVLIKYESCIHNLFFPEPDQDEAIKEYIQKHAVQCAAYQLKLFMEVHEVYQEHNKLLVHFLTHGYHDVNIVRALASELTDTLLYLTLNLSQLDKSYHGRVLESIKLGLMGSKPEDLNFITDPEFSDETYTSLNYAVNNLAIGFNSNWHRTDKVPDISIICMQTEAIVRKCFTLYHQIAEALYGTDIPSPVLKMFKSEVITSMNKFKAYLTTIK